MHERGTHSGEAIKRVNTVTWLIAEMQLNHVDFGKKGLRQEKMKKQDHVSLSVVQSQKLVVKKSWQFA